MTHPYEFKTYVTDPGWKQYRSKFTWVEKEVFGSIHRELDRDAESNWIEVFSHIQKEIVAAKQRHGSLKAGLDEVLKSCQALCAKYIIPEQSKRNQDHYKSLCLSAQLNNPLDLLRSQCCRVTNVPWFFLMIWKE